LALAFVVGSVALAQPDEQKAPPRYAVERGVATGGGYRVAGLAWRITGPSSGREYRVASLVDSQLTDTGCCCLYLPFVCR
jgi:hypothetical protein